MLFFKIYFPFVDRKDTQCLKIPCTYYILSAAHDLGGMVVLFYYIDT